MLKRAVTEAAKILDRKKRGWAKKINLQTLNMLNNDNCVLGQIFGTYSIGFAKIGLLNPGRRFPFTDPTSRRFWIVEIQKRLKKK